MGIFRKWWFYPLAVLFLLALAFAVFQGGDQYLVVPSQTFVEDVRSGEVEEIVVQRDDTSVRYRIIGVSGEYQFEKAEDVSVKQLLADAGVDSATIGTLDISEEKGGVLWGLLNLALAFLPLLIIVGLIAFFMTRQRKRVGRLDPVSQSPVRRRSAAGSSVFQDVTYFLLLSRA